VGGEGAAELGLKGVRTTALSSLPIACAANRPEKRVGNRIRKLQAIGTTNQKQKEGGGRQK